MAVHRAIGKDEIDVVAAGATRMPFRQLEGAQVRDEIGLSLVAAGAHSAELALTLEVALVAESRWQLHRVVKDEVLVVKDAEHERHVSNARQASRLGP
jgi:hypothetical protein